jgi:hypothetical protein
VELVRQSFSNVLQIIILIRKCLAKVTGAIDVLNFAFAISCFASTFVAATIGIESGAVI